MDKPTRERTIIVNVNGEKKEYKWIPSEDPDILDVFEEIASTVEEEQQPPLWIVPDDKSIEKKEPKSKSSKKPALLKYVQLNKLRVLATGIPVLIALITGTFFGVVVLKIVLFGGEEETVKIQESIPAVGSKTVPQGQQKINKDLNAFVVQGGVYSSKQAAEQRATLIENDGIPTIIFEQEDKYFIYIGAASTLEETKQLALLYKEGGVETYWKEIHFQGETKKSYSGKEAEIIRNMIDNTSLYTKLVSGALLHNETSGKVAIKSIKIENIPKELQNLHNLSESMNKTWSSYQSNPEESTLMQLQKCILQFHNEWYKL